MSIEQAYSAIVSQALTKRDLNLVFSLDANKAEGLWRVNITQSLGVDFQSVINRAIDPEIEDFVPYDPMYKLEREQMAWIEIASIPEIQQIVSRVSAPDTLPLLGTDDVFMTDLRFYAIAKEGQAKTRVTFFRKMAPTRQLKRSKFFGAIMARGSFDTVDDRLILFDSEIDCFSDGNFMFIRNVKNFERIFNYLARLQANAEAVVDEVLQVIPVSNAEEFRAACVSQVRFMTKLASVSAKPFFRQLSMEAIRKVIKEHDLEIEVVGRKGKEKLVFDPSPSKRWMLLKLLDDDFLNSIMTGMKYSVNSKQTR